MSVRRRLDLPRQPGRRGEIWAIIRLIRASGIAAVIVDRNFAAVSTVADRTVILVKGHAAYAGASSDLKAQPEIKQQHLGV